MQLRVNIVCTFTIDEKASNEELEKVVNEQFNTKILMPRIALQEVTRDYLGKIIAIRFEGKS
jgi:hypothetical protein